MRIPRYYFAHDFEAFHEYFLSCPHTRVQFQKGDFLWTPDTHVAYVYYILSGIALTSLEYENGSRKITSLHSAGTVFPGAHRFEFKIERSISTVALSDVDALRFTNEAFLDMICANRDLTLCTLDWNASYINLLLYESAHQEYNCSFVKLCNLLYLFLQNSPGGSKGRIDLTQENIAEILTVTRVNAARNLARLRDEKIIIPHRRWIEVTDPDALASYCSRETLHP